VLNKFAINPSLAGSEDFLKAQVSKRYQFLGIEGAPNTTSLAVHGKLESLNMGWGTMIYKDTHGAFSKVGMYGAYAYKIPLDTRTEVSFGINLGLVDYTIDVSNLKTIQDEPLLNSNEYSFMRPDATFGASIKSKRYHAGVTIDQLFNNKIELITSTEGNSTLNRVKSHFNIMGGYIHKLSYGFDLEPTAVIRYTGHSPIQIEGTVRLVYEKTAWAGFTYRSGDAFALLVGYTYNNMVYFGYSYDMTYTDLRKDTFGSHEVLVGFKLHEK